MEYLNELPSLKHIHPGFIQQKGLKQMHHIIPWTTGWSLVWGGKE